MSTGWRFDFGAWSTFGQTALLIFAAMLIAQIFAFLVLRSTIDQWQDTAIVEPAVNRFAEVAKQVATAPAATRGQIITAESAEDQQFLLTREANLQAEPQDPHQDALVRALVDALHKRHVSVLTVNAFFRGGFGGPPDKHSHTFGSHFAGPPPRSMTEQIDMAAQLADRTWLVGRLKMHKPMLLFFNPFFLSQGALFIAVLGASLILASRISRPLRILARAAEELRPQDALSPIHVVGPRDVRAAIMSFNMMAKRVKELLEEKDRMLSAISHDLRTPLASLRIRADLLGPERERERVIETIDEMTKMVDAILNLARQGRSDEPRQLVDLSALADAIVEEFRELGKDAVFQDAPRTPLSMQVGLVRRLLRNLIDNAVKYGKRARVSVTETSDAIELRVEDDGPGIPPATMTIMLQPFTRLEGSRSRETGGMGLGLSIADAIARSQGATLLLQNRSPWGLSAIVKWSKVASSEKGK